MCNELKTIHSLSSGRPACPDSSVFFFPIRLYVYFPGWRSRARCERCPAATCSSRAVVSGTGIEHEWSVGLLTGRGEEVRESERERNRGFPRGCVVLTFCPGTSVHVHPEDGAHTSSDRGRSEGDGAQCYLTGIKKNNNIEQK